MGGGGKGREVGRNFMVEDIPALSSYSIPCITMGLAWATLQELSSSAMDNLMSSIDVQVTTNFHGSSMTLLYTLFQSIHG